MVGCLPLGAFNWLELAATPSPAGLPTVITQHDQCDTPQFWQMIARNADRQGEPWREAGTAYGSQPRWS